jgi:hypothetical protein
MAPIGLVSFLEYDNASRSGRETCWRGVLLKRSFFELSLSTATGSAKVLCYYGGDA